MATLSPDKQQEIKEQKSQHQDTEQGTLKDANVVPSYRAKVLENVKNGIITPQEREQLLAFGKFLPPELRSALADKGAPVEQEQPPKKSNQS